MSIWCRSLILSKGRERYQATYNGDILLLLSISLELTRDMASELLWVSTICVDMILALTIKANDTESIHDSSIYPLFPCVEAIFCSQHGYYIKGASSRNDDHYALEHIISDCPMSISAE